MEKPTMQNVYEYVALVENLKQALNNKFNFEACDDSLKTELWIYKGSSDKITIPFDIQKRYEKFNNDVKKLLQNMISEFEVERDKIMAEVVNKKETEQC